MASDTTTRSADSLARTRNSDTYQTHAGGCVVYLAQQDDVSQYLAPPGYSADWLDWANHSSALYLSGRTGLAIIAARHALGLERTPSTLINLAVMLEAQSQFYPAFSLAEEAYRINPDHPYAAILYSDALLRMGRLAEAWPIYSRSHTNWGWVSRIWPEWNGRSSLLNKRILILSGGGFGDTFLHLRWLSRLKGLGAHVTFMCPASMHSLLEGMYGIDRLIAGSVAGLEGMIIPSEYDCYASLLSLGGYFCHTTEDIPITSSYLQLRNQRSLTDEFGLCFQAGEEKIPRRNRSLTVEQAERIVHSHMGSWRNLNIKSGEKSWRDTAEILMGIERVITVDTGVAHLVGAMGIPCWVILPGNSAAYYGVSGDRSAWYPSQRLFRNSSEGIDHSVDLVCAALEKLT